ncbi:MAG: hypothetical protein H6898_04580 [Rhodobacter sp.]|nr:hypothetical protein [Paracoccaceae bacterium]MCC0075845.1 hypothetical protein [Rhodobacter sp.]
MSTAAEACPNLAQQGPRYDFTGPQLLQPQSFQVMAGGPGDLSRCPQPGVGYLPDAPQFTFQLSNMQNYPLTVSVTSTCDATLLVNTAIASWIFDDDSNGNLNPRITLSGPEQREGWVDVWVGSFDGRQCPATLTLQTVPANGIMPPPSHDPHVPPPQGYSAGTIHVQSATYGGNCGAAQGNATRFIAPECDGRNSCDYRIDYTVIGDPVYGCRKDYSVTYDCGDGHPRTASAAPEAGYGSVVQLLCAAVPSTRGLIHVQSGTYGGNCGAPWGNRTEYLAQECDGQQSCTYYVDYTVIGDPVYGCRKDYVAEYDCGDGRTRTARAEPEAGYRSPVTLQCGP